MSFLFPGKRSSRRRFVHDLAHVSPSSSAHTSENYSAAPDHPLQTAIGIPYAASRTLKPEELEPGFATGGLLLHHPTASTIECSNHIEGYIKTWIRFVELGMANVLELTINA